VGIIAVALLVATWGALAWKTDGGPVSTPGIPLQVAPLIVIVAVGGLAWGLWSQSLVLLRGRKSPSLTHTLIIAVGGYLIWCLLGLLAGFSIADTWLSWYSLTLALIWGFSSLLCWALLARRVYTERPTPQWPWERRGEPGPDWNDLGGEHFGDDTTDGGEDER